MVDLAATLACSWRTANQKRLEIGVWSKRLDLYLPHTIKTARLNGKNSPKAK